jgi:glycine/D-amino acid oxidase-like deaminating enzyme
MKPEELQGDTLSRRRIVVVGAGIVGTLVSRELALRGAAVTVIDREDRGAGATALSFAWLTNQTYFRNGDSLSDEAARHYFGLHRLALGAWRRLTHIFGDALAVRWHGTVQLAGPESEDRELLQRDLRRRLAWGSPSYAIDAAQARALLPGVCVEDGTIAFHTPDEGSVDPGAALAILARDAQRLGVEFCPHTEALSVEGEDGEVSALVTSSGRIDCDGVVVLAGADSPGFLAPLGVDVPLVESTGSVVHLRPLPRFLDPVLLSSDIHAIQRQDGRVVMAKHYSGSPVGDPDEVDGDQLLAEAARVIVPLRHATVEKVTVGRRVVPIDGLPIVGRSTIYPAVHSITTNAGITLGPILAQLIATEVLDDVQVDVLDPYRSTRFV